MRLLTRFGVAAVTAGLALALLLLPAEAADEVDQQSGSPPSDGTQSWAALDALRQTFKPGESNITRVDLYLEAAGMASTSGAVDVTLEVKVSGVGTVVGTDTVTVPGGFEGDWITFEFDTADVTPGGNYELLTIVDDNTQGLGWGNTNTDYPDGAAYTVSGMILTPQAYDFLFITYHEACGNLLFGSVPPPGGGFGTFAFDCGTLDQLLEVSGCPEESAVFFYNKPDGTFAAWIPGSLVGVVNAEFLAIFNGDPDVEDNTIFTARCV